MNDQQSNATQQTDKAPTYPFALPPLTYAYSALEPYIDEATMRLHHDKHHQTYIDNLNAVLKEYPQLHDLTIEQLLSRLHEVPDTIRQTVRDQGGGHANHQFFWKILRPGAENNRPHGALAEAMTRDFGSFESFQSRFTELGVKHFASGWVFLVVNPASGTLEVFSRPNHESVLLEGKPGLLINDVWEHAYYLKYQQRRTAYLEAWWNVVNWDYVNERLAGIRAGKAHL